MDQPDDQLMVRKLDTFSLDQAAGAFVMIMGAIGSLLLVIWQSKCECDLNCCYLFRCHRKPPPEPEAEVDEEPPAGGDLPQP
tara:strand:+ start:1528 stop:1773 length:246 start_codon:yes stop_codon:yes gene_type:complete